MNRYTLRARVSWQETIKDLSETFRLWNIRDWSIVPMSPPRNGTAWERDRKVTLRFQPKGKPEVVLPYERQERPVDNLRVLYLAVEAMRKNELRGVGSIMQEAYVQLSGLLAAGKTARDPYEILGVRPDAPFADIEDMYKIKARRLHPDAGGDPEAMAELNKAFEEIKLRSKA